jgi:uncharacterized protein (DUF1015 family)
LEFKAVFVRIWAVFRHWLDVVFDPVLTQVGTMAEIHPFRALRFDITEVGDLSQVVCPPYDVIDPAFQQRLHETSPFNIIRLEYGLDASGDDATHNKYTRAAATLREWIKSGVLSPETTPAIYLYEQEYTVEGQVFKRRGFFARVRLEAFGEGRIYPHEQTLSGPKADRLNLFEATRTNLSPIFGLYPDETNAVLTALEKGVKDRTPITAIDHLGVINRMWPVTDDATLTAVRGLIADKPVFIADGHHRYETGLNYQKRLAAEGKLSGPDDPANFVLMTLVSMSDPGLLILPTHRLISGLGRMPKAELVAKLSSQFEIKEFGKGPEAARAAWDFIESSGDQERIGFGTAADDEWIVASLRSDARMDSLCPSQSAEWRSLGVSILRELVVKDLLAAEAIAKFKYVHLLNEVLEDKGWDVAALVPSATMEHVQAIASGGETMPPKSTYFYPKLLTGMVVNPMFDLREIH